jgi:TetR/AcrR family transcriptional repressor of nem operon
MNKGEITRQRIIEVAAPLFNKRGFAGCSMQDIMDATGLEKGGLYRHFASKEELAAEAFNYALASVMRVRMHNADHIEGAINRLNFVIKRFAESPSAIPGGCPLMNVAIDADDGNPVLRGLACEGIRDWKSKLAVIVEQGIESGEIRSNIEPRRIANTIIATLEGALMISRIEGSKQAMRDAQESLEAVLSLLKANVLPDEPPARRAVTS